MKTVIVAMLLTIGSLAYAGGDAALCVQVARFAGGLMQLHQSGVSQDTAMRMIRDIDTDGTLNRLDVSSLLDAIWSLPVVEGEQNRAAMISVLQSMTLNECLNSD